MVDVGGGRDLDADFAPSLDPPLFRTVPRRTTDLTAAVTGLAALGRVLLAGSATLGSLGVVRRTVVVPGLAQLPGLVAVLPEAGVEGVEFGQPIRVVLLLDKLSQVVQPCKAVAVLAIEPNHLYVLRVLRAAGFRCVRRSNVRVVPRLRRGGVRSQTAV